MSERTRSHDRRTKLTPRGKAVATVVGLIAAGGSIAGFKAGHDYFKSDVKLTSPSEITALKGVEIQSRPHELEMQAGAVVLHENVKVRSFPAMPNVDQEAESAGNVIKQVAKGKVIIAEHPAFFTIADRADESGRTDQYDTWLAFQTDNDPSKSLAERTGWINLSELKRQEQSTGKSYIDEYPMPGVRALGTMDVSESGVHVSDWDMSVEDVPGAKGGLLPAAQSYEMPASEVAKWLAGHNYA